MANSDTSWLREINSLHARDERSAVAQHRELRESEMTLSDALRDLADRGGVALELPGGARFQGFLLGINKRQGNVTLVDSQGMMWMVLVRGIARARAITYLEMVRPRPKTLPTHFLDLLSDLQTERALVRLGVHGEVLPLSGALLRVSADHVLVRTQEGREIVPFSTLFAVGWMPC